MSSQGEDFENVKQEATDIDESLVYEELYSEIQESQHNGNESNEVEINLTPELRCQAAQFPEYIQRHEEARNSNRNVSENNLTDLWTIILMGLCPMRYQYQYQQ